MSPKAAPTFTEPFIEDDARPSAEERILLVGDYPAEAHPRPLGPRRDYWTQDWIYRCQPVVTANQMGYVVHTPFAFTAEWNGADALADLAVIPEGGHPRFQVTSHFGMGIITVQAGMTFRTADGIGLLVKAPPNINKPVRFIEGFVETDVLRRDFTFNIEMTAPGFVRFEAGDPVGCILPYPVDWVGRFDFEAASPEQDATNRLVEAAFAHSRHSDHGVPSLLYRVGVDAFGEKQRRPVLSPRKPKTYAAGE